MKQLMLAVLAMAYVTGYAQNNDCHITVKLKTLKTPVKAYLVREYGMTDQQVIDSAEAKQGAFVFTVTVDAPQKAEIVIDHAAQGVKGFDRHADLLVIYLEKGNILVKGNDSVQYATVSGSALNTEYAGYHAQVLAAAEKAVKDADATFLSASDDKRKDTAFLHSLFSGVKKAWQQRDSLKYVYIRQHPNSYLSLDALIELAGNNIDVSKIEPLFNSLSAPLRNSRKGADFAKAINEVRALSPGAIAPDFTQNDINDKPVKLSDFRGKYVLLDFWASWCGPCRAENPNVVKAYNKYSSKNFTVLSVSLDRPGKKDAWLAAIKADGLNWTQVSDLQFWNNAAARLYSITAIPQNFLIDPTGKIVARNLRGEELQKKLEEIL
jgi:peroxiredoxin